MQRFGCLANFCISASLRRWRLHRQRPEFQASPSLLGDFLGDSPLGDFRAGLCCDLFGDSCSEGTLATPDSRIVMVDGTFSGDSFEQDRSWDDSGTTISGIQGTHQNSTGVRMLFLIVVPQVDSKLGAF